MVAIVSSSSSARRIAFSLTPHRRIGTPYAFAHGGTSWDTTAPIPTIAPRPIRRFWWTAAFMPMVTRSPIGAVASEAGAGGDDTIATDVDVMSHVCAVKKPSSGADHCDALSALVDDDLFADDDVSLQHDPPALRRKGAASGLRDAHDLPGPTKCRPGRDHHSITDDHGTKQRDMGTDYDSLAHLHVGADDRCGMNDGRRRARSQPSSAFPGV